jgi:hypothetical protein
MIRTSRTRRHLVAATLAMTAGMLLPVAHAQEIKRGGTLILGSTQTPRH